MPAPCASGNSREVSLAPANMRLIGQFVLVFGLSFVAGYRTLRVAGRVTFWLSGAGKSVFQLVGTNYEDGQIVLLEG